MNTAKNMATDVYTCASDALRAMWNDMKNSSFCMAAEILFFIFTGFIISAYLTRMVSLLYSIGALLQGVDESTVLASHGLFSLLGAVGAAPYLWRIAVLFALMGLSLFALYGLFHGFIWVHVLKILNINMEPTMIFKRFVQVSILWVALFFVQRMIFFAVSLFATLRTRDPTSFHNNPILLFLLFIIAYFAAISYTQIAEHPALASIRRSFSLSIRRFPHVFAAVFVVTIIFVAINYALLALQKIWPPLVLIAGTVTVIPAMTWVRVFLTAWMHKMKA